MGKITDALKKAADDRVAKIERITKRKDHERYIVQKLKDSRIDSRIITYFDPKSHISEQYRILRTNIMSARKGKALKVITITSSIHSEGKTISAINLAITLAQAVNKPKILLIDADMRRGKLSKYLGVEDKMGLSDLLSEAARPDEVLFNIDIENLTFMSSGSVPHNPVELLGSAAMGNILSEFKKKFDYVLLDTPPVIPVADPGIIGVQSDGVLMIVQAGRTHRGIVSRSAELLHQAQVSILGYVLTNIEYHLPQYIYRYL